MKLCTTEEMATTLNMSVDDLLEDYESGVISPSAKIDTGRGFERWDFERVIDAYRGSETQDTDIDKTLKSVMHSTEARVRVVMEWLKAVREQDTDGLNPTPKTLKVIYENYREWARLRGEAEMDLYPMKKYFAEALAVLGLKRERFYGSLSYFVNLPSVDKDEVQRLKS